LSRGASEQSASSTRPSRISIPPERAAPDDTRDRASALSFIVELTSGSSEEEARKNYRDLQMKFPALLASRDPIIRSSGRRADAAGAYIAAVGPFATLDSATGFCGELKAAGAPCSATENPR